MKTLVYIDGFNFYYACYKGWTKQRYARYKWLNLRKLCETIFPDDEIALIKYFTARTGNSPDDPDQGNRQNAFLRALATLDDFEIVLGRFAIAKREAVLAHPVLGLEARQIVKVKQEKRSDVALTTSLLLDAFRGNFEQAVIITNDTDFVDPIRAVRDEFGLRIGVVSPDEKVGRSLQDAATFSRVLDKGLLAVCQFPDRLQDNRGYWITKPEAWRM